MTILYAVIIGFVVGLLARFVMPGKDSAGFILTTLLGIIGAVVGTLIGRGFGFYNEGEPAGFLMSVLGALIVLFIYKRFSHAPSAV